jgi:dolichol-phosphate mannosyltransferase
MLPFEPDLSVVIPVRNEAPNVRPLAAEIARACTENGLAWEVLWVDDGSTDDTAQTVLALGSPHRLLQLDRAHGQSAALTAGFRAARAPWIGTLDGDGQNDPADLPRQLAHAQTTGADLVNGIRARRQDGLRRRISSQIANRFRNALTAESVTDVGCSTRVVKREALAEIPFFHGMHRFLPTLVRMRGYRVAEIPVRHRPRRAGRSKYGIHNRLWLAFEDLFGVRWLLRRQRVWRAVEWPESGARVPADSAPGERSPAHSATDAPRRREPISIPGLALLGLGAVALSGAAGPAAAGIGDRLRAGDTPLWPWLAIGFAAQGLFAARFLVQWISSERAGRSVVPRSFWILSLVGGASLLVYFIHRRDPVGIVGQLFGVVVYLRNLSLSTDRRSVESALPARD